MAKHFVVWIDQLVDIRAVSRSSFVRENSSLCTHFIHGKLFFSLLFNFSGPHPAPPGGRVIIKFLQPSDAGLIVVTQCILTRRSDPPPPRGLVQGDASYQLPGPITWVLLAEIVFLCEAPKIF